jgi:hypothetical protein
MPGDARGSAPDGGAGLRVSDAERDVVAAELGEHFQDGRLNQDEFTERLGAALEARTRGDLSRLMTDLPPREPGQDVRPAPPAAAGHPAPYLPLVAPLLFAVLIAAGVAGHAGPHGPHHWGGPWPLLWLWWAIPAAIVWMRHRAAAAGDEGRGR